MNQTQTPEVAASVEPVSSISPVKRRMKALNDPDSRRILGLDVARALAILGMIYAHLVYPPTFDLLDPSSWGGIVNGYSAALFALLAGVSIAIITGGTNPPQPEDMPTVRLKLFTRGAIIFTIGLVLEILNTPVVVILTVWGLLYAAIVPFVRLSRTALAIWALAFGIIGPVIAQLIQLLFLGPTGSGLQITIFNIYPAHIWLSLMLAGMVIGRSDLRDIKVKGIITGVGAAIIAISLAVSFGISALANSESFSVWFPDEYEKGWDPAFEGSFDANYVRGSEVAEDAICEAYADNSFYCFPAEDAELFGIEIGENGEIIQPDTFKPGDKGSKLDPGSSLPKGDAGFASGWGDYLEAISNSDWIGILVGLTDPSPHSGSPVELWNSMGVTSLVLGLCLLIARPLRLVLIPLIAMGSMPLTIYAMHVLGIWVVSGPQSGSFHDLMYPITILVLAVTAVLIWLFAKRGPLESALNYYSKRAANEQP